MIRFYLMLLVFGIVGAGLVAQKGIMLERSAHAAAARWDYVRAIGLYEEAARVYGAEKDGLSATLMTYLAANNALRLNDIERLKALADGLGKQRWQGASPFGKLLRVLWLRNQKEFDAARAEMDLLVNEIAALPSAMKADKRLLLWIYNFGAEALVGLKQPSLAEAYQKNATALVKEIGAESEWINIDVQNKQLRQAMQTIDIKLIFSVKQQCAKLAEALDTVGLVAAHQLRFCEWLIAGASNDTNRILGVVKANEAFYLKTYGASHPMTGLFYVNVGSAYKDNWRNAIGMAEKDRPRFLAAMQKAIFYTNKGIEIIERDPLTRRLLYNAVSTGNRNIGFMMLETLKWHYAYDEMEPYFRRAFFAILPPQVSQNIKGTYGLPDFSDYANFTYDDELALRSLGGLLAVYNAQYSSGKTQYRHHISQVFQAWYQLLNNQMATAQNPEDIQKIEEKLGGFYDSKAHAYSQYWLAEQNIQFADTMIQSYELISAASTSRNLNLEENLVQLHIPKDLRLEFLTQRQRLQRLNIQRNLAQREGKTQRAQLLNDSIIATQISLKDLDKSLQKVSPSYAAAILEQAPPSLAQLQKMLPDSAACYIPTQAGGSILLCKDTLYHTSHQKIINLRLRAQWITLITNPQIQPDSFQREKIQFAKTAHELYKLYFPNEKELQQRNIKHLLVVANPHLGSLPVELLVRTAPDTNANYNDFDYLLKHYTIQYLPSLTLWQRAQQISTNNASNGRLLAYAPTYEKGAANPNRTGKIGAMRKSLAPLHGAEEEVRFLQNAYYGDYRFGPDANEKQFKTQLQSGYTVIHLAMHGLLNQDLPEHSALAFSETNDTTEDNFLEAWEIAQLSANAQLVVLSACETGIGQNKAGEGTMSIARYFLYAGAPAVVATRWQVNDQTTAIIMQHFYQNLYNGIPINQAIRQAQLLYLQNAAPTAQHPFFWAPYMNIGYTDRRVPLANKNWATKYYITAIAVAILLALFAFLRYSRRH